MKRRQSYSENGDVLELSVREMIVVSGGTQTYRPPENGIHPIHFQPILPIGFRPL
jgi:hypothetical protein